MARTTGSDGTRTKTAIRAAATRLFARYGYEALSMRRLAEEIDLGAAALYRYFPTKQAILFDLLKTHMDQLLAAWDAKRPPDRIPARERLNAFAEFHIRHHWDRNDSLFLSYMELRSLTPDNFAQIEDLRRAYENEVVTIISDGIEEGSLRPQNARVTARAVIALMNGLPAWYREDGPISPPEIEKLYQQMVSGAAGPDIPKEIPCSTPA